MDICQVTPRYPPRSGGVETHVEAISTRLADRGHDVTVITADAGSDATSQEKRDGVSISRHHGLSPGGAFHIAPGILTEIKSLKPDVLHAHNYHSLPVLFSSLWTKNYHFVVTTHYHGGSASSFRDVLLSAYHPFGRWALRRADSVVAVSRWERRKIAEDFNISATVIPNGVSAERFSGGSSERRERPYLLTVGRLEEYKCVQDVIKALPGLSEFDLLVAGDGPYRNKLQTVAHQENVSDRVEFLGYVADERLPSLYAGATVYVTLSQFEAYGMTVSEALTAGTPCVVREVGALKDWTERDDCIGAKTTRPDDVVSAVRTAAGRSVTKSLPSWDEVVDELIDCYEN